MFSLHSSLLRSQGVDSSGKGPYVEVTLKTTGLNSKEKDRAFKLDGETQFIKIGRANSKLFSNDAALDNNCYIESPIVSRRHARFVIGDKDEPVWLIDEGSTHGTFIDRVKLPPHTKTFVKSGATVAFGAQVINGPQNYFPSKFKVSYDWHMPPMAEIFRPTAFQQKLVIQAPTPTSDSEDDESDTTDGESALQVIALPEAAKKDSVYIDLTDEPENGSGNELTKPRVISLIQDDDEENGADFSLKDNPVINAVKRSFRFVYDDSDPEEEEELTSPGTPHRDHDSLYDNTDDESDVPDSPSPSVPDSVLMMMEPEQPLVQDGGNMNTLHEGQTRARDQTLDREHLAGDSKANSLDADKLEHSKDALDAEVEELQNVMYPPETVLPRPSTPVHGLPEYNEARTWLGLDETFTAHQVVDSAEFKIDANEDDESYTLLCVSAIAEGTSNRKVGRTLEDWIDSGGIPLQPERVEVGIEQDEEEEEQEEVEMELVAEEEPYIPLQYTVYNTVQASFPVNRISTPQVDLADPYRPLAADLHIAALDDIESQSQDEPCRIPDSFDAPANSLLSCDLPSGDTASSSVMRIAHLVETTYPRKEEGIVQPPPTKLPEDEFRFLGPPVDALSQRDYSMVDPEQQASNDNTVQAGHKRKLGLTGFERDEEYAAALDLALAEPASMPFSETSLQDAQVLSQQPTIHHDSANVQTLSQTSATNTKPEPDRPSKHKRRHIELGRRPSLIKTLATHIAAGALGAFGVVAAIVATTPASLQEELLRSSP